MAAYTVFFNFEVHYVIIVLLLASIKDAAKTESISNKRLCADKECNVVISRGRALASHLSSDPAILSFRKDDVINIKSKSAGSNPKLWGGECNGQRGYFDRNFVREIQVYVAHPQFLENTEPQQFKDIGKHPPTPLEKADRRDHFVNKAKITEDEAEEKPKFIRTDATRPKIDEDEDVVTDEFILSELEPDTQDKVGSDSSPHTTQEDQTNVKVEPDLKEAPSENEDHHDDDWEDLDKDYFETDRGRFDTSGFVNRILSSIEALNQFVKQSLGVEREKSQEDPKVAHNVDATFQISPQEAIVNKTSSEDASPLEPTQEKPLVEPPTEKSSVESPTEKPSVEPSTEKPSVEPSTEKPSVEPPTEKSSVEPPTEKPSVEPPTEKSSVEPPTEKPSVEPPTEKPSVEPPTEKPSVEPPTEKFSIEPTKGKPFVDPPTENSDAELTKEKLSVELPEIYVDSPVNNVTVETLNEKSNVASPKDKATVELPKISVEIPKSQSVGDQMQDDKSVSVEKSFEKDAASHEPGGKHLVREKTAVEEKENSPTEKVEVQHDDPDLDHGTNTGSQETKSGSGKLSDDDGIQKFEIDDNEENDIGADMPVFDSMSAVSRDRGQKGKKLGYTEPQTVVIPTADYADRSKEVSEEKADEINSKVSVSRSENKDITVGQVETMKANIGTGDIISGGSNAKSDDEVAGSKPETESGATKQDTDKTDDKLVTKEKLRTAGDAEAANEKDKVDYGNLPDILVNESEVRPDTPSGETPEQGQSDDQVSAQVVKEKNDMNIKSSNEEVSEEMKEKLSPVDLNHFQRDENKAVAGGFEGFLQPSSMTTHLSEDASSTPSLDSADGVVESVTNTLISASDIHYAKATGEKLETAESNEIKPDHLAADKFETVIEAGSTIILDAEGNIVSAFMPVLAAQTKSTVVLEHLSTVDKPLVTPTAVREATVSSAEVKQPAGDHMDMTLQSSVHNEVSNNSAHVNLDKHLLDSHTSDVYKSSDFSSRKVLSVNNQPPEQHDEHAHHHEPHDHHGTSHDHRHDPHDHHHDPHDHHHDPHDHHHDPHDHHHDPHDHHHDPHDHHHDPHDHHHDAHDHLHKHHIEHPHKELPEEASPPLLSPSLVKTQSEELSSVILGTVEETLAAQDDKPTKENGEANHKQPANEEMSREDTSQNKVEASTQPPEDYEIPPPPTPEEEHGNPKCLDLGTLNKEIPPQPRLVDDQVPGDFDSGDTYHSRKINDEKLLEDEEPRSSGFVFMINSFIEMPSKFVFERLPPWMMRSLLLLEPLGLSPGMTLLVALFSITVLVTTCLASVCSLFQGKKKPKLRATLDVIGELEAKLQLAVKEKENLEDSMKDIKNENQTLKEDMLKQKKNSGKNEKEIHAVQHQNEILKIHVLELEKELQELKKYSVANQGEAKQTNKKAKELEKQIKNLEEKEKSVEQENQKLTSELRHKEEQLVSIQSKVSGLTEQIGHLQISKDQLLSEAEDWKEKVIDLKERLQQRDEEFKQMQENIMFKDNELEVLKDCFLQLKSFEEEEAVVEDGDVASQRVQEKLNAMMDVSKVNALLRAIDEERNMLSNRLHIESEARKELEEQLENSRRSVESSMADKMKAERQCQEAQTKLNVLSSYFKEKEMQLQRELGEHEALKKQNLNKLVSADETTRTVQQEMEILRTQVESLKRELASSERDFRSQIAANEKKAHENWLAARAAERELKEARHDAGVLRQKLTDIERRQFMGPGGLIRPLPTRGLPPPGMLNGPPPPSGMDRSPSRGSLPPLPPPHLRDEEFLRRGPPMGIRQPHPEARSPPLPPFADARSPPPRMPPPGMLDGRSPPPYDRRPPPPHMLDRRSPPFRLPPPDMLPHPMRGGPLPPPHFKRGGSPSSGADSPHLDRADGRYPPPYARNSQFPPDRPSPRGPAPRQQQSQV